MVQGCVQGAPLRTLLHEDSYEYEKPWFCILALLFFISSGLWIKILDFSEP
jgi:hypothetical protein